MKQYCSHIDPHDHIIIKIYEEKYDHKHKFKGLQIYHNEY